MGVKLLLYTAALVWGWEGGTCQMVFAEDPIIFYVISLSKP